MRSVSAWLIAAATAVPSSGPAQSPRATRPNIIYIMTDDHAAHAIGAYGSRVNQTPNLDRLARGGTLLTNVFATNSICTPSLAVILTGQYSHLNGVTMFNRFDSSRTTVARLLQPGGQYTGRTGKWAPGSGPAALHAAGPAWIAGAFCRDRACTSIRFSSPRPAKRPTQAAM